MILVLLLFSCRVSCTGKDDLCLLFIFWAYWSGAAERFCLCICCVVISLLIYLMLFSYRYNCLFLNDFGGFYCYCCSLVVMVVLWFVSFVLFSG